MITVWIAHKNLPLNFFSDEMTQQFFKMLNPNVSMPMRNKLTGKVACEFSKMQDNLKKILQNNKSKFSFTIDAWTARNGQSFYGITIHFIDELWDYHSLALDLVPAKGKHSGKDICSVFYNALQEYEIQHKIQGITMDNASANTTFIKELSVLLTSKNIDFDADDHHFRCFPHILNLAVQDVLKLLNVDFDENVHIESNQSLDESNELLDCSSSSDESLDTTVNRFSNIIFEIRNACKKIRKSEQLTNRLKLFCDVTNVKFIKLILDVKTRWDSTFDMLSTSFKLKSPLNMLLDDCSELSKYKLNDVEWEILEQILNFLKNFKYVSKMLCKENEVTLPTAVVACNMLIDKIENSILELDNKKNRTQNDEILLLAFQASRDKILKHYRKCNWIYCISLILDPRHKIQCFDTTSWGKEMKVQTINKFESLYKNEYYSIQSEQNMSSKSDYEIDQCDELFDLNSVYETKNTNNES